MKGVIVILVLFVIFIVLICGTGPKENFNRYNSLAYSYPGACEFQPDCLYDTARWIQLSNGMEGVCTLNGTACPAFSKDHSSSKFYGKVW